MEEVEDLGRRDQRWFGFYERIERSGELGFLGFKGVRIEKEKKLDRD